MKLTTLTVFNCTAQRREVRSRCCATGTTIHPRDALPSAELKLRTNGTAAAHFPCLRPLETRRSAFRSDAPDRPGYLTQGE